MRLSIALVQFKAHLRAFALSRVSPALLLAIFHIHGLDQESIFLCATLSNADKYLHSDRFLTNRLTVTTKNTTSDGYWMEFDLWALA